MHGEERTVDKLPPCDFCKHKKDRDQRLLARYDGITKAGPWRNMCLGHFKEHGVGVGIGHGQRLWLRTEQHLNGEVPVIELPPVQVNQVSAECDICGKPWFVKVLEYFAGKGYCPMCLRECFPVRKEGPFTFGDIVVAMYPWPGDDAGEYIGRVLEIPEQNVLKIRFEYEEAEPEDVLMARDGLGGWWDTDNERSGIAIRLGVREEAEEYERLRKARIGGYNEGRPTQRQVAPWGGQAGLFEEV